MRTTTLHTQRREGARLGETSWVRHLKQIFYLQNSYLPFFSWTLNQLQMHKFQGVMHFYFHKFLIYYPVETGLEDLLWKIKMIDGLINLDMQHSLKAVADLWIMHKHMTQVMILSIFFFH